MHLKALKSTLKQKAGRRCSCISGNISQRCLDLQACCTATSALKDSAWEQNGSRGFCLGSEGGQSQRSSLAGEINAGDKMWVFVYFPCPRYVSEKPCSS